MFAGERSALAQLLRDVHRPATDPDIAPAARVQDALAPLILKAAVAALDAEGDQRLRAALAGICTPADLQGFVRASLEVFATIVALPETGIFTVMAAALLRTQLAALEGITGPIDPDWRVLADERAAAVTALVGALAARDLAARRDPAFMRLFAQLAHRQA